MNCLTKKKKKKIKYFFFFNSILFFYDLFINIIISKKNIFLQFYIVRNDFLGKKFLNLLKYKSFKILIILLIDNVGSKELKINLKKILFYYNKNKFLINFRNHKKIVFLDNKILWIGGNNVGKEYINLNFFIKYWNDFHCKIKYYFPNFIINDVNIKNIKSNFTIKKIEVNKSFFFINKCVLSFLNLLIFICKKKIIIMSPYIILDIDIINLLKILKNKNIEIKLLISYKTDNYFIHFSSLIFLKLLNKYIKKIFFLKNGFFHRKLYILDNKYIIFGSMNFDIRSIYINKECLFIIKHNLKNVPFYKKIFFNLKKKHFFIKFIYILSFLNYYIQ